MIRRWRRGGKLGLLDALVEAMEDGFCIVTYIRSCGGVNIVGKPTIRRDFCQVEHSVIRSEDSWNQFYRVVHEFHVCEYCETISDNQSVISTRCTKQT